MKVSIITVCFNAESTIRDTIESVLQQDYNNIEYIIVDGASSDRTLDIINKHKYRGINIIISEPDRGLYDAMNKGIDVSSGDVIAILNSDDVFANKGIISNVVMKIKGFDILYGDVAFYRDGNFNKIFRYYSSGQFSPKNISRGIMPAHPAMFVRKTVFDEYGNYNCKYRIAADFDFVARVYKNNQLRSIYNPELMVKMRLGGISTQGLRSNIELNSEIIKICKAQGIKTNWLKVLSKYPRKILGLILKI
ncbi:MAG: glycosyltransferase [Pseudomonadales bacterium]|nr:glycosyltransferase [Pseudomonadales bacterium]MCP5214179.1 glycosyltransferase [Pseudomonadales bacterium]MCP5302628.1 glycosyltransferase [Pseudomonadales bacterium]